MRVGIISHTDCAKHEMGVGHPESPARIAAINDRFAETGVADFLSRYEAPLATREQLERAHDAAYVQSIFDDAPTTGYAVLDPDTSMNPFTLNAALRAAGAAVAAVDRVLQGEIDAMFCNVRPPGHHAERKRAMGFCFFNNVAVGVMHALEVYGVQRVAIIDFDVHHGNGTEGILSGDTRVMLCSSFQHPHYPYSGADTASDNMLNLPLPAGTNSERFRHAVRTRWFSHLENFRPELVFFSAGFDSHRDDPLGGFNLTEDDYSWLTGQVCEIAKRHNGKGYVSTLEGGYDLSALARSAEAHIRAFIDA